MSRFMHSLLGPNVVASCCVGLEDSSARKLTYSKWDSMTTLLFREKQTELLLYIYTSIDVTVHCFRILLDDENVVLAS
jgi:hypothetical protein